MWARFTHTRGDIGEAICGMFATDVGTRFDNQRTGNPNSRCVEVGSSTDKLTEPFNLKESIERENKNSSLIKNGRMEGQQGGND